MLLPPSSFKVRLIGFLGLMLSSLFGAWIWHAWTEAGEYVEEQERAQVQTLVRTLAPMLNGDLHEQAAAEFPDLDIVPRWESAPEWLGFLRQSLVQGARYNELESPLSTLRLRDEMREVVSSNPDEPHVGAMEVMLTSSSTPNWRHSVSYQPEMGLALFGGQTTATGVHEDSRGSWISAFAPVRNDEGQIVAILRAEAAVSDLLIQARNRMKKRATFGLIVLIYAILGCALLALSVTRALTQLQSAAQRLGDGDYTTPFHIHNEAREIQDVTEAFESARVRIASHIEAQERLNSALEITRHDAEAANRAKSLFLANMSHDLRTPLNAIIGFVQLLRQSELKSDQVEMVDTIQRAGESLHEIVGDILDFSKISEGKLELFKTNFDVRSLVQEVGEVMLDKAHAKGLELNWSCNPSVPNTVRGDAGRLRQILGHLIDNGIKFTDIGSVSFRATLDHADQNHALLRFEVVDTGIGIEPQHRERLFEPFARNDEPEGLSRGTGIGLSLSRSLCQLLGGEIGADSTPGQGSTFWFTVQLEVDAETAPVSGSGEPHEAPPALPSPVRKPTDSRRRILIAEDSAVNRRMALHMVRKLGYEGEVAVDGLEAVDAVRCEHFDAILMDCQMPRMDGIEAARLIRELGGSASRIPIIAFTATADDEDRKNAMEAGMVDIIGKPIALADLQEVLERWCSADSSGSLMQHTASDASSGPPLAQSPGAT